MLTIRTFKKALQWFRPWLMCCACLPALLGCIPSANAMDKVVLQLAWKHQFQFAGYYAAREKGFYKEAGLDVAIVEGRPELEPVDEVVSGRAHFGVGRASILLHRLHGKPVMVLASVFQHSANILLAKRESGIASPQDMTGRRVMLLKGDDAAEHIAMFRSEGVLLEQINAIPSSFNINDLIEGKTDVFSAYITNEPYYLEAKNIPVSIIRPISYGIDFYGDCLFTSEPEVNEKPDRVKHFRAASLKGWEYAMAHPEEIINLIRVQYEVNKTKAHLRFEAAAMGKLMMPDLIPIGHMNPGRWKHMADTYVDLKMADPGYSLEGFLYDPNPLPDYTWIRWALGVSISIGLLIGLGSALLLIHNKKLRKEIKQRKTAEMALNSEKAFSDKLIQANEAIIVGLDKDHCIHIFSEGAEKITGYQQKEVVGKDWFKIFFKPDQLEEMNAVWGNAWENNPHSYVNPIMTKASKEKTISWTNSKIEDTTTQTEFLLCVGQDISERIRAEKALKESEEQYRSMMASLKDAAYICSPAFRIEYMNPAMKKRIGRDATGEFCYKAIYKRDDKCPWCIFDKVEKKEFIDYEVADPKDNRYFSVSNSPVAHSDGTVSKLTLFHDITEIKAIEENLRQARKIESVGTLTGGIAHDFNNILSIILGNTELALGDIPKWSQAHMNLKEIRTASLRARDIIRRLLSFSRKTGKTLRPVNIAQLVQDALKFLRSTIPTTIAIHQDIQADEAAAMADPVQLNQVMMNLCINASQAMEKTGGKLMVRVEKVMLDKDAVRKHHDLNQGPYVRITVSDTGPGIDDNIIERVFDPYFTTREVGKGSGMGLAVVHGIVNNHGGSVSINGRPGSGAVFNVLLPLADEKPKPETRTADDLPTGSETLLFVDDETAIVEMTGRILERLGYRVETRTDPTKALNLFATKPDGFDLVITDMTMPGMTGAQLAEKLKDIRPDVPVVICTGHSSLINEKKAKKMGIDAFVMKPITQTEIAKTIRKVLDGKN